MTFSSMTFVILLRWLKPPTATAAAATHCSGDRRLLHHEPRHSRDQLGRIDDLHHHDLRHHDAVADGDMLRWLQLASSSDLNCSDCHYISWTSPAAGILGHSCCHRHRSTMPPRRLSSMPLLCLALTVHSRINLLGWVGRRHFDQLAVSISLFLSIVGCLPVHIVLTEHPLADDLSSTSSNLSSVTSQSPVSQCSVASDQWISYQ